MKSICFESYRQSKKEKYFQNKPKPKPKSLDPSWYTDNIYSNRSIDLEEEYIPECIRYGTWKRLRNISEQEEYFEESGSRQNLQRSASCKDFKYPKSKSCCFGGRESKSNPAVPKSYSFSVNSSKTQPFDVIDYEPPPPSRRDKKMMRKSMDYYCHDSHSNCCAREHCTNAKCLLEEIYNYNRRVGRDRRPYATQSGSRRNLMAEWDERNRKIPPRSLNVCDDYCYRRTQPKRRPCMQEYTPNHNDNFGEHFHCRSDLYETDVDHFIRDERSRLLSQDKFLDDDERYLRSDYHPIRNKSMLEVQPPSKYDEDTCSESTEMDLEDFNFDLEKYWEELEKPPSPIDLDMQQRNMNTNMKVKNVNVGCYNNGTPIDIHDREHERMMIKKSLLEGMPSPPQNNSNDFHFFDHQRGSPFHRSHKVYPETIPSYKYNNFYPQDHLHPNNCNQQQSTGHSALSLINNIFSIYKPNKYSPLNCQLNKTKPEPCKKMNVPSTIRPLGAPHSEFMHSMKRPLIVSTEQPQFKIIPEKTGLKISPFYRFEFGDKQKHKLTSTARPLLFPH